MAAQGANQATASLNEDMEALVLDDLGSGTRQGLTAVWGNGLAEVASVCLDRAGHTTGAILHVQGDSQSKYQLVFGSVTQQMRDTHGDHQDATELGAYGIACLLVERMEGVTAIGRSCKGTGFDYWLGQSGKAGDLFQASSRLEVSGIAKESGSNTLNARVKEKLIQTEQSDDTHLPAVVVVILFEHPRAHKETRL